MLDTERTLEQAVQDVIAPSIEDHTDRISLRLPQTLHALYANMGDADADRKIASPRSSSSCLERLRRLPVDTRAVFAILVDQTPPGDSVSFPLTRA